MVLASGSLRLRVARCTATTGSSPAISRRRTSLLGEGKPRGKQFQRHRTWLAQSKSTGSDLLVSPFWPPALVVHLPKSDLLTFWFSCFGLFLVMA